jgi:hypothetical protein
MLYRRSIVQSIYLRFRIVVQASDHDSGCFSIFALLFVADSATDPEIRRAVRLENSIFRNVYNMGFQYRIRHLKLAKKTIILCKCKRCISIKLGIACLLRKN